MSSIDWKKAKPADPILEVLIKFVTEKRPTLAYALYIVDVCE